MNDAPFRPLIALIGFGAIGQEICRELVKAGNRVAVLVREMSQSRETMVDVTFTTDIDALIAMGPVLAVEAAGQQALKHYAPPLLGAGLKLVSASVGVAADPEFLSEMREIARKAGGELIFPAGAVGGLDYLRAVAGADDLAVTYVSRKPVAAWAGELRALGHDPQTLREPVTLFTGSASEAARLYPKNLNAGLTIALAVGLERTEVQVVADPSVSLNTHEIVVNSRFGDAFMRFANQPSPDNPKTSAITAASLLAEIRTRLAGSEGENRL